MINSKKYRIISITILTLMLYSCQKEIDINVPDSERKLVLNCAIEQGKTVSAFVFKSGHKLDNFESQPIGNSYEFENPYKISDASVFLYENNIKIGQLSYTDSIKQYILDGFLPKAGNKYRVEALHNNFKPVKGETSLPLPVEITAFDSIGMMTDFEGYEMVNCEVKIKDPAGVKNYYSIRLERIEEYIENDSTYEVSNNGYPQSMDPALEYEGWSELYFTDAIFDGKEYSFKLQTDSYFFKNELSFYFDSDSDSISFSKKQIFVKVHSLSKEMYYYKISASKQMESEEFELVSQPTSIFNNIENGFGIVGGKAVSQKEYK